MLDWGVVGVNGAIAVVFLWLSSRQWIEPEVRDIPGASGGGPVVFSLLVLWILVPLLILNPIWLGAAIWRKKRTGEWIHQDRLFAVMAVAWVSLILFSASKL